MSLVSTGAALLVDCVRQRGQISFCCGEPSSPDGLVPALKCSCLDAGWAVLVLGLGGFCLAPLAPPFASSAPLHPVKSLMSKTECLVLKMFSGFSPISRTNTDMLPGLLHLIFFLLVNGSSAASYSVYCA